MTKTPIPAALQRVTVHQDATQDDAARIEVDYTGGGDVAHLTVNPDLVDDTALSGYQVRAAIQAALEPSGGTTAPSPGGTAPTRPSRPSSRTP